MSAYFKWKKNKDKKEQELEEISTKLQLSKQRTEEACEVAALNQLWADATEWESGLCDKETISIGISQSPDLQYEKNSNGMKGYTGRLVQRTLPVKLKGVDLPKFSGEDKTEYEPWKAAFMSIVDIPVGEKMPLVQSSLSGKAQILVKDLGYSKCLWKSKGQAWGEVRGREMFAD